MTISIDFTDLNNLTKTVTNVYNVLSKNEHSNGNNYIFILNSKSSVDKNNKHPSKSNNLKLSKGTSSKEMSIEEPSSEENQIKELKEENANLTNGMY